MDGGHEPDQPREYLGTGGRAGSVEPDQYQRQERLRRCQGPEVRRGVRETVQGSARPAMTIETLAQALLNGFALALVYVLVALGLTLIFSIFEIINFAHGEFYMLGGYVTYVAFAVLGIRYFVTLFVAVAVGGLVGLVAERLIFRHLRGRTLNAFIVSLGL